MNVNWATKIITVYKTDSFMTWTGGTVYNMDTNAFRLALKDAEDDPIGMPFPDTHRHNTTVLLGGIEYARIIEILPPYTITFDDAGGAWVCNLVGSNNNILDRANLTTAQIRSNNSAGLVQMQEIQYASFEGGVTVDTLNGVSDTVYPSGTRRKPVNNLADAMTIAALYGFGTIYVVGDLTIDSGGNYTGLSFIGESKNKSTLTVSAAANVYRCEFYEAHIAGVLDGDSVLRDCLVDNLNYVSGFVERCVLAPGVITLGGSTTAHFLDCYSGVPGMGTPTIDMGGDGPPLAIRNYNGGIALMNKSGNDSVSIDLNSGQVVLDSTVTAGQVVIRGVGKLTNNSVGATVNSDHLLSMPEIIAAGGVTPADVWTYGSRTLTSSFPTAPTAEANAAATLAALIEGGLTLQDVLRLLLAVTSGDATGLEGSSMAFKSLDGTKNRIEATYATGARNVTVVDPS